MCFKDVQAATGQLRWYSNDKSTHFTTDPFNIILTLQKWCIVKHIQIMIPKASGTAQTVQVRDWDKMIPELLALCSELATRSTERRV